MRDEIEYSSFREQIASMKSGGSPVLAGLEETSPDISCAKGRKSNHISKDAGDTGSSEMHLPEHLPALKSNESAEFCLELKG